MRNICRPIILYSKQIPVDVPKEFEWEYLAFGAYDGISIEENIFSNNLNEKSFSSIWNSSLLDVKKLEGNFDTRIIYGFRTENEDASNPDYITDEHFSKINSLEMPFLFVSMLQLKEYKIKYSSIKRTIEEYINENGNDKVKGICYFTMDNADIVLLLKTEKFKIGAGIIRRLQAIQWEDGKGKSLTTNYGFTICGFNREILNLNNVDFSIYNDTIDEVNFCIIEKNSSSVGNFAKKLDEKVNGYIRKDNSDKYVKFERLDIFGNDDGVIIWKNAEWKYFLQLYRKGNNGLLTNESKFYRENVYNVCTQIKFCGDNNFEPIRFELESYGQNITFNENKQICIEYRNIITNSLNSNLKSAVSITYAKYILQLLNSLEKFERSNFSKYLFISVYEQVKMFMKHFCEKSGNLTEEQFKDGLNFFNALHTLIQNSSDADRDFFQTPDFNMAIYNFPAKFGAFYTAFVHNMIKLFGKLNQTKEQDCYEVLMSPWFIEEMHSVIIFDDFSAKDKLILMKVPEIEVFSPEDLLIHMGHEIAHFVGHGIRNRDLRYIKTIKIILNAFRKYWEEKSHISDFINQVGSNEVERFLYENLVKESANFYGENIKENSKYLREMNRDIPKIINDFFENNRSKICSFIILEQNKKLIYSKKPAQRMKELSEQQDKEYLFEKEWNETINYQLDYCQNFVHNTVINVTQIISECFADLLNILILKLSVKDYVNSFNMLYQYRENGDDISKTVLVIRISAVISTMFKEKLKESEGSKRFEFVWNIEEWEDCIEPVIKRKADELTKKDEMIISVNGLLGKISLDNTEGVVKVDDYIAFNDYSSWEALFSYLLSCRCAFEEGIKNEGAKEEQENITDIYTEIIRDMSEKGIEYKIQEINRVIENYLEEISC